MSLKGVITDFPAYDLKTKIISNLNVSSMRLTCFAIIASVIFLSACTSSGTIATGSSPTLKVESAPTLVGAWEVTSSRTRGVGKNMLTFSSDGTFFRSGDSHPVVSGGHGAWKRVGPSQYNASYVSFTFDASGKWIGVSRNNLQLDMSAEGQEFKGTVKSSNRDLEDNELSRGSASLAGKRIQVQPF